MSVLESERPAASRAQESPPAADLVARRLGARIRDELRAPLDVILRHAQHLAAGDAGPESRAAAQAVTTAAEEIAARLSRFEETAAALLAEQPERHPEPIGSAELAHRLVGELNGLAHHMEVRPAAGELLLQPRLRRAARLASLWLTSSGDPVPDGAHVAPGRTSTHGVRRGSTAPAPSALAGDAAVRALVGRLERLEEQHRELQEEAASSDRRWRVRLHELRSAAHVFLSWGFALRRSPARTAPWFAPLMRAAEALLRRAEEALDPEAFDPGEIRPEPLELESAAREALEALRPAADLRDMQLALTAPSDSAPVPVVADPDRLQQVLQNLVRYAIESTPAAGSVWLSVRADGAWGVVELEDSGPGLSAAAFAALSRPAGGRTEEDRPADLGLAFAREMVERMGGRLTTALPAPGSGARFILRLPAPV